MLTVQMILDWLDKIAPFDTAEDFDNVGLLVGDASAGVEQVLFCVDVTESVVQEAKKQGAQLIISHHPLMFGGISRIDYTTPEGRVLRGMMENGLHMIAAHTNWDKAEGGVADSLAVAAGLEGIFHGDEYIRIGTLAEPMTADDFSSYIQQRLHAPVRRYGEENGRISCVAVGPGSCGGFAETAVMHGAHAFVVGEVKHHELLFACGQGLVVIEAGHFASEAIGMASLYQRFLVAAKEMDWTVQSQLYSKAPFWGAYQLP